MSEQNYIYAPGSAIDVSFKCKVPMKGTRQLFIVDGKPQGSPSSLTVKYAQGERPSEALQVIGVRTSAVPGSLSFSTSYHFGQDSVGRLILCSHTFAEDSFETTENCSIVVEKGASVEVVLMQNEHNRAAHFLNMAVVPYFGKDFEPLPEGAIELTDTMYALRKKDNKDKGQRQFCGCANSKDIGQYNTCPHLCEYCYANSSKEIALSNWKKHKENPFDENILGM